MRERLGRSLALPIPRPPLSRRSGAIARIDHPADSRRPDGPMEFGVSGKPRATSPRVPGPAGGLRSSSRIRWVISRSQSLHHFQWRFPTTSSRCLVASRMLGTRSCSPRRRPSRASRIARSGAGSTRRGKPARLPLESARVPWKMYPMASTRASENSPGSFQTSEPRPGLLDQHNRFPNPSDIAISIIRDNLTETSIGCKMKTAHRRGGVCMRKEPGRATTAGRGQAR